MSTKLTISVLFFACWFATPGFAQEEMAPGKASLVVLRNGRTLLGEATYQGDRYLIRLAAGGEISLKQNDIEFVCRDVGEAYLFKSRKISPKSARQHLDLAEWCLRQSLYSRAASELMAAMEIDPKNKRIARLERRLTLAVSPPVVLPTASTEKSNFVSMQDIEESVSQLDLATVKEFRTHVQPLLLNRCHGCHGMSAENECRLFRPFKGRDITRRTTQRNMYAAIKMIDRGNPKKSLLLTQPVVAHGGTDPILTSQNQAQIARLKVWVWMVAQGPQSRRPHTIQRPDLSLLQNKRHGGSPPPRNDAASAALHTAPSPKSDPFDPAAFNQRYSSDNENLPSDNAARN